MSTAQDTRLTDRWYPLRFHKLQSELFRTRNRWIAVAAGRGSGKTEVCKRKLVKALPYKVHGCHRPMYFFAGPVRDQTKRIAWNDFKALVPRGWLARSRPGALAVDNTDLIIRTEFGSELHVAGMDRPQRIEGDQWCGGVGDEQSDTRPSAFGLSIRPALSHYAGWFCRIGVPKRQGVGAVEFRQCFVPGSFWEQYSWPSSDILSASEIRLAQQTMDARDYAEQYDANWVTAGGRAFYSYGEHNKRRCSYDPSAELIVGSDFNVDPMAWVLCHNKNRGIEVFDELWLRDANTPGTLNVLHDRYRNHRGGWRFIGDATGAARKSSASQSDYKHIKNDKRFAPKLVSYPASNPPVRDRLSSTNALLKNAAGQVRMWIDPCCTHLHLDFEMRSTDKSGMPDDKIGTGKNKGDVGHITDAAGYVCHMLYPATVHTEASARIAILTE